MMNRRAFAKSLTAAAAGSFVPAASLSPRRQRATGQGGREPMARPVQLHCDLAVDPAKEADMVRYFETVYRPTGMKFQGYIDLRLLKLRSVLQGRGPARMNYRFSITYETEELRQKWINSNEHQVVWPTLQSYLTSTEFDFLLFELI
jgi:hypothetical protein